MLCGQMYDPKTYSFRVRTAQGTVKIIKESEDGVVSGLTIPHYRQRLDKTHHRQHQDDHSRASGGHSFDRIRGKPCRPLQSPEKSNRHHTRRRNRNRDFHEYAEKGACGAFTKPMQ